MAELFVEVLTNNDPDLLEEEVYEQLEAQFEGWEPAEGNLEVWLIKAFTRLASIVREQAAVTSREAFKRFGQTVVNVPPVLAAPATVASTWTMINDAGYTIPTGTKVQIVAAGDQAFAFQTIGEIVVAPGDTETAAGEVVLQAVEAGEEANGLSEDPTLIDSLAFVDAIALTGVTSGGVDDEDEDAYLDRLTEALQLLSLSLILPRDFEVDARAVAGIARALCIPNYNPDDESDDNALMLCVFPADADGGSLGPPIKTELQERQQGKVPVDVVVKVGDPTHTGVDVDAEVEVLDGFDKATVTGAAEARLAEYLSSANWPWADKAYFLELVSEVDRVRGVGRVVSLKLAKAGGVLGTADVSLDGPAPLAEAGEITVSAA